MKYASLTNKYFSKLLFRKIFSKSDGGYAFHAEIQHVAVGIFGIWVEKSCLGFP